MSAKGEQLMSLPEFGFQNKTKYSSVRGREIVHQDIFDAVVDENWKW